jgi:UDP-N-acetylglucosamine 2-epimerase (non-hydrolysing)
MGTRPEAIKMAPIVRELAQHPTLEPWVVHTGQHQELIDQVIELFQIPVDCRLDVMRPGQSLASLTARLVDAMDEVITRDRPDMVLVQGDTTSVLAAALASFYRQVPVGHVEAGLRTGNMLAPFPEEGNRRLTTPLAALHFAPTPTARDHLLAEGIDPSTVFVTGNTVIDALEWEITTQRSLRHQLAGELDQLVGISLSDTPLVLVTGHRRESFGEGFEQIAAALLELAELFADHVFVYPVHANPNVKEIVHKRLGEVGNIRLIPPLSYRPFVALMSRARLILTDSGGVQEEAPSLGKPVLVMRDTTERPEGVAAGTVRLVGARRQAIVDGVAELLTDPVAYRAMAEVANPYGDGQASPRIVAAVANYLRSQH